MEPNQWLNSIYFLKKKTINHFPSELDFFNFYKINAGGVDWADKVLTVRLNR